MNALNKIMAVWLMVAVVAGAFAVTLASVVPKDKVPRHHAPGGTDVTLVLGEMFISVEGAERRPFPIGTPVENIVTISGAADGEISILFKNVGKKLHEIYSPLFKATEKIEVQFFDVEGNFSGKFSSPSLTEFYILPGWSFELRLTLGKAIVDSLAKDPDLRMAFEISCHVPGHYEAGQRAFVTLAP